MNPLPQNHSTPAELYHNSSLSVWLSVDPLSDKYPSVSPYVYCGNNPVRLVDVDGRDIWELNEAGYSRCVEKSDTEHKIYFTKGRYENAFGERLTSGFGKNKSEVVLEHDNVDEFMTSFHPAGDGGHLYTFIADESKEKFAKQFMQTVSKYTAVEWGYTGTKDNLRHISTSHTIGMDEFSATIVENICRNGNLLFSYHTQPNNGIASSADWSAVNALGAPQSFFGIIYDGRLFDFNGFSISWPSLINIK